MAPNLRSAVARSYGLHGWRFFLVELLIIFFGVFGATTADDWRQRRFEGERHCAFYEAGSSRLKPVFRENLDRLRDILALEAMLARRARVLRGRLEAIAGPQRLATQDGAA